VTLAGIIAFVARVTKSAPGTSAPDEERPADAGLSVSSSG
jgi:hypothetical protein